MEKYLDKYFWIVIIFLSIPSIWALLVPGFYGASDDLHIGWLYEMHRALLSGKIPPRFVPDLSFGFGYPLFNFVFPLPFYLAEIFHLVGVSLVDSIKSIFLLSLPISGIFMYLFLRQFSGGWVSLAGATVYIYSPYRAVDIYIRGAIGEIVSFVFLPLILLSVLKISQEEKGDNLRWISIYALSLAGLVLSHNITAYMFLPYVFLLSLLLLIVNKNKKKILNLALSIFIALLISSYFWIPAILESNLMKYDTVFNFIDHFPTIRQLITPYWGYGASVPGPYDGMSFFLGFSNLFVIISGLLGILIFRSKISKKEKIIFVWAFICIISAIFFMNYRSSFLWQTIPLMPYFQFPWRFLIITTVCIPVFLVGINRWRFSNTLSLLIIVFTIGSSFSYFKPQDFLGRIDSYYINRYIPYPEASSEYLNTQEEYLRLPTYTKIRPNRNYPYATFDNGEIKKITKFNVLDSKLELSSENGGILNVNKYYFPGWTARLDDSMVKLGPGDPFGQITVYIPPGMHSLEVRFEETPLRVALNWISILSLIVVSLLIIRPNLFKMPKSGKIKGK